MFAPLWPQLLLNIEPLPSLRKETSVNKTRVRIFTTIVATLAFTGTAAAQWTPAKPGDPRTCPGHTASECATAAASFAFKAKYTRVTGHVFVNTLRCTQAGSLLSYSCAWGTPAIVTPVRFAHKAAGWKVAVGVIPG